MTDNRPSRETPSFKIFEWPQPICEIYDKRIDRHFIIDNPDDARAIRDSLNEFLRAISKEFGGEE